MGFVELGVGSWAVTSEQPKASRSFWFWFARGLKSVGRVWHRDFGFPPGVGIQV